MNEQNIESRIGKVEGQLGQLATQVSEFVSAQEKRDNALFRKIDEIRAPNTSNQIAFASVVLAIVVALGGLTGFFAIREWDRVEQTIGELDIKLQREYQLSNETTKQAVESIDKNSLERHQDAIHLAEINSTRLDRFEAWQNDQIKAELQELRERRAKILP